MGVDHQEACTALDRAYAGIGEAVAGLTSTGLLTRTRCHGWLVVDLLFHVLCDAQRCLVALASPVPGPADHDHVSYWTASRPRPAIRPRRPGVDPAVRAAARADPDGHVTTQGHVLAVPEFLRTLAAEAAIHHLDLILDLPSAPPVDARASPRPSARSTACSARTPGRTPGATRKYVLKATGRVGAHEGPLPLRVAETSLRPLIGAQ